MKKKLKEVGLNNKFIIGDVLYRKQTGVEFPFGTHKPVKYNAVDMRRNEIHLFSEEIEVFCVD